MSDRDHARLLLDRARMDHQALGGMMDEGTFADEIFGFHAQQAAEKAIKAWLSLIGAPYPRTHDLEALLSLLEKEQQSVPEAFRSLVALTDFAVQFRYETLADMGERLDRQTTIEGVVDLIAHVGALTEETPSPKGSA